MNDNLPSVKAELKTGNELLLNKGATEPYTLLDFWRWSASDLLSNATRGKLAEFIVGSAIGLKFTTARQEWDVYDLTSPKGIRIEVKSAAYIQSWAQKDFSRISFSIKPSKFDTSITTVQHVPHRHSDIYVFCLLHHKNQDTINPLNTDQWSFFVVSTNWLNQNYPMQSNISLHTLLQHHSPCTYSDLSLLIQNS